MVQELTCPECGLTESQQKDKKVQQIFLQEGIAALQQSYYKAFKSPSHTLVSRFNTGGTDFGDTCQWCSTFIACADGYVIKGEFVKENTTNINWAESRPLDNSWALQYQAERHTKARQHNTDK